MRVEFTSDDSWSRADEIAEYLLGPRLWVPRRDYPDYDDWVERTRVQLRSEDKRALTARSSGRIVGAVVYQRHRSDPGLLEIKNVSVRPDCQDRLFAAFLLRNAEVEGCKDFGVGEAVVDAKARNAAVASFLVRCGYLPEGRADLYGLGAGNDLLFRRRIRPRGPTGPAGRRWRPRP